MIEQTLQALRTRDGRRKFFDDFDKTYGHMLNSEKGRQATLLLLDGIIRSDRLVRHVFFRRCIQRLDLPKDEEGAIRTKLNLGKDAEVMRSDEYRELVGPYDPDVAARGIRRAKPKSWWRRLFLM
jgi:hypothetical protein